MDGKLKRRIKKILCFLGLHSYEHIAKWLPDIQADIITNIITYSKCNDCPKISYYYHSKWDGENMVKAEERLF